MNKQEMLRDMKSAIGSYPNISKIAEYMGWSRDRVSAELVQGLEYIKSGREKQYFANDIVSRLYQLRNM